MKYLTKLTTQFESRDSDARFAASEESRIKQCTLAETAIVKEALSEIATGELKADEAAEIAASIKENIQYLWR